MDLYNILSINGINIDEYLNGGGSSEDINEIKSNTFILNNNNLESNMRLFNYDKYNNYMIKNYSTILCNRFSYSDLISFDWNKGDIETYVYNYVNSVVNLVYDAFNLNTNIELAYFNNVNLQHV